MNLSMEPAQIVVNGVVLHYIEQGRGAPVVFVHGSVNDYRAWALQMAPVAEHYRAITYSRRYHYPNVAPGPGDAYAAATQVEDLAALVRELGLGAAHLVGSSYGALVALVLAAQRPELVRTLMLGEPPLLPWLPAMPGGEALLAGFMSTALGPAGEAFARGEAERGVQAFIDGVLGAGMFAHLPPPVRADMLDNADEMRLETVTPATAYFPAFTEEDARGVERPTLLVSGELSPALFGRITDALEQCLPQAERVTIPAASHAIHAGNPPAYNHAVLSFLARQ